MSNWNRLDLFIAWIRYRAIDRFISGPVVCDIGCGRTAEFLRRHSANFDQGYGFDFRIRDGEIGNITLINNQGMDTLPLPDNCCDTVSLLAVLEHLEAPESLLREICRVLRPGGRFVMTTPTRLAKPILEFMAFRLHIINEEEILEHKHYYARSEILALLSRAGLSPEHYRVFSLGVNSLAVAVKDT